MSKNDNFAGGFLAGAVIGGIVGGILGALLTQKDNEPLDSVKEKVLPKKTKQPLEETMETSRLTLEEKIAQLNHAIDDVRIQLGSVNGNNSSNQLEQS